MTRNSVTWVKSESLGYFESIEDRLLTTHAIRYAYHELLPRVRERPVQPASGIQYGNAANFGGGSFGLGAPTPAGGLGPAPKLIWKPTPAGSPQFYPSLDDFKMVGHSLWVLLLAYVGGKLAQYLERTRKPNT